MAAVIRPGRCRDPNILPLLLRAYPFVLTAALASSHNPDEEKFTVTMDQALADRPTDTGAPMTTEGDKLARGVEQRLARWRFLLRRCR